MKDFIVISVIAIVFLAALAVGSSVFISNEEQDFNFVDNIEEPSTVEVNSKESKEPVAEIIKKQTGVSQKPFSKPVRYEGRRSKKNKQKRVGSQVGGKPIVGTKEDQEKAAYSLVEKSDIKGRYFIKGHILNLKNDQPLGLVKVSLYTKTGQFIQRVRTNKDGLFELKDVPLKDVHLMMSKKDFVKLKIKHYDEKKLKQHLLEKLDPGVLVSGTVLSKKNNVSLIDVNIQIYRGTSIVKTGVKTDNQGRFEIKGLPKGKLEFIFSKTGFSRSSMSLELEKSDVTDLKALLEYSSTLQVEVLTDISFKEIPLINVYFDNSEKALRYDRSILSQHQNKNIFIIHGVEGNYNHIAIQVDGFVFPSPKALKLVPGEQAKISFNLISGWTISGKVISDNGSVLSEVDVQIYEIMGLGKSRRGNVFKGTYTSDINGLFEVSGISKGKIEFLVESTVYKRVKKQVVIDSVSMPPFEIILLADSFFDGTVKSEKGEPIEVHQVRFTPITALGGLDAKRNRPRFVGSQKIGHFKMSGVVEGLYKISITARKYKALILTSYIVKVDQKNDEFTMKDGLTITGIIKDQNGVGLADASIWFTRKENKNNFHHKTKTDSNGFYSLESIDDGKRYLVYAQASGYVMKELSFDVTPESTALDLVLDKKKEFTGVVYDADSRSPVQHFQIKLLGAIARGLVPDSVKKFNVSNGQFSMPVSAKKFTLILTSPGYADIMLKDRTLDNLKDEYYLKRGGSLFVTVSLKNSLAGMKSVVLSKLKDVDVDQNRKTALTNNQGVANFQGLEPGRYYYRIRNVKGYANYSGEVDISAGEPSKEIVQMLKGFVLKGRLISTLDNRPIKTGEAYLDFELYKRRPIKRYINQDGFFEFPNVIPGKHTIKVNYGPIVNKQFKHTKELSVVVPETVSRDGVYVMETIEVD